MIIFAFVFQVILVRPVWGYCSVPKSNRSLSGLSGIVTYNTAYNSTEYCYWTFPVQSKDKALLLYVRHIEMTYTNNKCSARLRLPEEDGNCKIDEFGCLFYKTPSSSCALEEIVQYVREKTPSCSKYTFRTVESMPATFLAYTYQNALNWSKSFTLKYEYISCKTHEPTTTDVTLTEHKKRQGCSRPFQHNLTSRLRSHHLTRSTTSKALCPLLSLSLSSVDSCLLRSSFPRCCSRNIEPRLIVLRRVRERISSRTQEKLS